MKKDVHKNRNSKSMIDPSKISKPIIGYFRKRDGRFVQTNKED
jgi:hypothetical protein